MTPTATTPTSVQSAALAGCYKALLSAFTRSSSSSIVAVVVVVAEVAVVAVRPPSSVLVSVAVAALVVSAALADLLAVGRMIQTQRYEVVLVMITGRSEGAADACADHRRSDSCGCRTIGGTHPREYSSSKQ